MTQHHLLVPHKLGWLCTNCRPLAASCSRPNNDRHQLAAKVVVNKNVDSPGALCLDG